LSIGSSVAMYDVIVASVSNRKVTATCSIADTILSPRLTATAV
jgi:hypothetical protein